MSRGGGHGWCLSRNSAQLGSVGHATGPPLRISTICEHFPFVPGSSGLHSGLQTGVRGSGSVPTRAQGPGVAGAPAGSPQGLSLRQLWRLKLPGWWRQAAAAAASAGQRGTPPQHPDNPSLARPLEGATASETSRPTVVLLSHSHVPPGPHVRGSFKCSRLLRGWLSSLPRLPEFQDTGGEGRPGPTPGTLRCVRGIWAGLEHRHPRVS